MMTDGRCRLRLLAISRNTEVNGLIPALYIPSGWSFLLTVIALELSGQSSQP